MDAERKLRNKLKNDKRKQREKAKKENGTKGDGDIVQGVNESKEPDSFDDIEIEYVSPDMTSILNSSIVDPSLRSQFLEVFSKFAKPEELMSVQPTNAIESAESKEEVGELVVSSHNDKLSNKKKKLMTRLTVSELKQLVPRPDVVEAHDITSSDPRLLVYLKAYRNAVPVPRHWCSKRKYLAGKRGIEKPPFKLPEFIADTGIARIRDNLVQQEALKKAKQKARDRTQVKLGKLDIDYQVLHDAFFKFQTKPKLTIHGDLYYEGKEFEIKSREYTPGVLSNELKEALGITSELTPPPWLINMQRYGPPPSYPNAKIPGLNAPLPAGAAYGFHAGGWGKPPVNEYGQPLYGDVFGVGAAYEVNPYVEQVDTKFYFGEYDKNISDHEEDEEEGEEEEESGATVVYSNKKYVDDFSGMETPVTVSGISSVQYSGLQTPDVIDIRKRLGTETPDVVPRDLYQVVQERSISGEGQFFKSDKAYVLPGSEVGQEEMDSGLASSLPGEDASARKKRKLEASAAARKEKEFKF